MSTHRLNLPDASVPAQRRLAGLFAALLAACADDGADMVVDESYGCNHGCSCYDASADVLLSTADYASWLMGEVPEPTTGEVSSEGVASTSDATGTTDTTSTGTTGESADTGTTADTTTDTATSDTAGATGEQAPPDALSAGHCLAFCQHYTEADDWDVRCSLVDDAPADQVHVVCTWIIACEGRRHACLDSSGAGMAGDPLTAWLARATHDEAGSVHAFDALHRELADHGAPDSLLRRVRRAAADERSHTVTMARLVEARGGCWRRPRLRPGPPRDLRALALENAVEGCVRETWSALSAAYQAAHASDPAIRAAMVVIAVDERRHAELAWAIDRWLARRIVDADRIAVERARTDAARALRAGLAARRLPDAVVRTGGVPDGAAALRLVDGLTAALWSVGVSQPRPRRTARSRRDSKTSTRSFASPIVQSRTCPRS